MQLYKYLEPARIDVLENERIAFTPPGRFKDPFEFRPTVVPFTRTNLKQRLDELIKGAGAEWWQLPEAPKGFSRNERRKANSRTKKEAMRQIRSGKARFTEGFQDLLSTKVSNQFGVICFCSTKTENLMWYHYADGHRGFVIEFDCEHPEFLKLGKPVEVTYSDNPPIYELSKPSADHWRAKPKYLKYEAEYRILAPLPTSTRHKTSNGQPLYLAPLPHACIKAIYFGHRMEKSLRDKIFQILKGTTISKFDAIPSRNDYALTFQEIK